jgi:hypothetical protein
MATADHPCDVEWQTGHRPRPCPVTQPPSSAHGRHYSYLQLVPLSLDVLSFLSYSPFSLGLSVQPTSTTINPYADNHLPTAVSSGMPPWSSVPAENYARPVHVASMRVVSSSRADRRALSAAIPPLLGRGAFACAHTVQDIAG